jgi:hypothetical protein
MGRKVICNIKSQSFSLKWYVFDLEHFSKSEKKKIAQNIIKWAEK